MPRAYPLGPCSFRASGPHSWSSAHSTTRHAVLRKPIQRSARLHYFRRADFLHTYHRGVFRLRIKKPNADRPYRAFGYPWLPALYIIGAATILIVLFTYRPATTWPGLIIVILGVPVYFLIARSASDRKMPDQEFP